MRFFCFLLLCSKLIAEQSLYTTATFSGAPQASVESQVSASSGQFFIVEPAVYVKGCEPIVINKIYSSGERDSREGGWSILPQLKAEVSPNIIRIKEPDGTEIEYIRQGFVIQHWVVNLDKMGKVLSNNSRGVISGKTNYKNNKIYFFEKERVLCLIGCDGNRRYYSQTDDEWLLTKELKTNHSEVIYSYDLTQKNQARIHKISTYSPRKKKNYAWAKFEYFGGNQSKYQAIVITTSDGNRYEFKGHLHKAEINEEPGYKRQLTYNDFKKNEVTEDCLEYLFNTTDRTQELHKRTFNKGRQYRIGYYEPIDYHIHVHHFKVTKNSPLFRRVYKLEQPVGTTSKNYPTHAFRYNYNAKNWHDSTVVYEMNQRYTVYNFNRFHRLQQLTNLYWDQRIHSEEKYFWRTDGKNIGNLSRIDYYSDEKKESSLQLEYGNLNNVRKESIKAFLTGESLTPKKFEEYSTHYEYENSEKHLLYKKREDNGLEIRLKYLPNTDLITEKKEYGNEKLIKREFREYNEDNVLVAIITDDGSSEDKSSLEDVTTRLIHRFKLKDTSPGLNLPIEEAEYYVNLDTNEEILSNRVVKTYNKRLEVIREEHYDARNILQCCMHKKYDQIGNLIYETDPIGRESFYSYDQYGRLISERKGNEPYRTYFTYDFMGRPIHKKVVYLDMEETESYKYDFNNNLIEKVDRFGNKTNYSYDEFSRCIEEVLPAIGNGNRPVFKKEYRYHNQPIKTIDPEENQTDYQYNSRLQPIHIQTSNGSSERKFYNLDGSLNREMNNKKIVTSYLYDDHKRVIQSIQKFPDGHELIHRKKYDQSKLISEIDPKGNKTSYLYDFAGRIIEQDIGNKRICLEYDDLGRKISEALYIENELHSCKTYEHDLISRLIKENEYDYRDQLVSTVEYEYDCFDNLIAKTIRDNKNTKVELFRYDSLKRLVFYEDPEGNQTYYRFFKIQNEFGNQVEKKVTIDPKGYRTEEIFNERGLLFKKKILNLANDILITYEQHYNLKDQLTLELIYGLPDIDRRIERTYDESGNVTSLIEIDNENQTYKSHFYKYDETGRLSKHQKPSGVILQYEYNAFGEVEKLTSSDGSVHYSNVYDSFGRLIESNDRNQKTKLHRSYDQQDQLIEEILPYSNKMLYEYDDLQRQTFLTLPDQTGISYEYRGQHLKRIVRTNENRVEQYAHTYNAFDSARKLINETLINGTTIQYERDLLHRILAVSSDLFGINTYGYDPNGNLYGFVFEQAYEKDSIEYDYDEQNQLISEKGIRPFSYSFDGIHNRRAKNGNDYQLDSFNQVIDNGEVKFDYNQDGCRIAKSLEKEQEEYVYDALDRLVRFRKKDTESIFVYDYFNRLVKKITSTQSGQFEEIYLYDHEKEIGVITPENTISQLKINGVGFSGDIGAAVAIEIDNAVYIPIQDLMGNIFLVLDGEGHILENIKYSAFGESETHSAISPWQFQSKRYHAEMGLYHFHRRFYDPDLGRWISPDPLGYTEAPNLFHYLFNNPFASHDTSGLSPTTTDWVSLLTLGPGYFLTQRGFNGFSADNIPKTGYIYEFTATEYPIHQDFEKNYKERSGFIPNNGVLGNSRKDILIIDVNGIATNKENAIENSKYCSSLTGHESVTFHNASGGAVRDIYEAFLNICDECTDVSIALGKFLSSYLKNHNNMVLLKGYSHGAAVVSNSLHLLQQNEVSKSYKERIYCIAVAPARFITKDLCKESINLVSWDIVPVLQNVIRPLRSLAIGYSVMNNPYCEKLYTDGSYRFEKKQYEYVKCKSLESGIPFLDHSFRSKSYESELKMYTNLYIEKMKKGSL